MRNVFRELHTPEISSISTVCVGFADVQLLYSPYPNALFNVRYICDVGQLLTDVRPYAVNDTSVSVINALHYTQLYGIVLFACNCPVYDMLEM